MWCIHGALFIRQLNLAVALQLEFCCVEVAHVVGAVIDKTTGDELLLLLLRRRCLGLPGLREDLLLLLLLKQELLSMHLLSRKLFGVTQLLLFDEIALTLHDISLFLDRAALLLQLVSHLLRIALFLSRHQLLGLFKDGAILLHNVVRICTTRLYHRLCRLLLLIHAQPDTMIILQLFEPCEVSLKFLRCFRLLETTSSVACARAHGHRASLTTHVIGKLRCMHLLIGCHSLARHLLILHNAMTGLDHGIR